MSLDEREAINIVKLKDIDMIPIREEERFFAGRKVKVKCLNGHVTEARLYHILDVGKCMRCEALKYYENVVCKLKEYGYKHKYSEDKYKDTKTIIEFECDRGHIQNRPAHHILKGLKCSECLKYNSFDDITDELKNNGHIVLTTREQYVNSKVKVEYICPNGHMNSHTMSYLLQGKRCGKCGIVKSNKNRRTANDKIIEMFSNEGYEVLSDINDFENYQSRIITRCPNGHVYETTLNIYKSGCRCAECSYENRRGENNYGWKGGIRPLSSYMRDRIIVWRTESLRKYNYRCFITNEEGYLNVHHAVNFSNILEEVMNILKIDVRDDISNYSKYELSSIEYLLLKKHYEYGLGIPMLRDVHKLFHAIYGIKNNTMEQVLEFKQDYLNGKFDDVLSA